MVSGERIAKISLSDTDYENIADHIIDGRNLFPATGYLVLVWESIGLMRGELYSDVSVVFEDVKFLRATTIPKSGSLEFTINVQKGSGRFEIFEGDGTVVTGYVRSCSNPSVEKINTPIAIDDKEEIMLSGDIYKELKLRGYDYAGYYRSLKSATTNGMKGHILWRNDWISFMDILLQMSILGCATRRLFIPTSIKKLVIDTKSHFSQIPQGSKEVEIPVYCDRLYDIVTCGGVEIHGFSCSSIPRRKPSGDPVLEVYKFVPHHDKIQMNLREIVCLSTHIAAENYLGIKISTIEILDESEDVSVKNLLSPLVAESLGNMPLIQAEINVVSLKQKFEISDLPPNVMVIDFKKINKDTNALLVIGHKLLTKNREQYLNSLLLVLKSDGFLLTREIITELQNVENFANTIGLEVVLEKQHKNEALILLRKSVKVSETMLVVNVTNDEFNWIEKMRNAMSKELKKENNKSKRIIFVGEGNFENGLIGLINCLRKEPGGEIVRGILVQDPKAPKFAFNNPLYANQLRKDLAISVLRDNSTWGSYRHLPLPLTKQISVRHALVCQVVRNDLSSFTWIEGSIKAKYKDKNLINIVYSAVNFKDVMLSTGKIPAEGNSENRDNDNIFGMEFSGIREDGKRVMGLMEYGALANIIISDPTVLWEVPDSWTLEEAATVPCVYGTCYYGLYMNGHMKKGDKILIHSGTGGIGQAAINLALYEGCEVFVTVGSIEKRRFILDNFPQIHNDHIGNSRDTSFVQMIKKQTRGQGVDIVLNSLSEEKLLASVSCLAPGGRFLEIGKFDLSNNSSLGMKCFLKEVSFHGVMMDLLLQSSTEKKVALQNMLLEGLKNGAVKPLNRTVFGKEQVEEAYRFMAAGKHIGKVIIKIRDENEPLNTPILAQPRFYSLKDRSYIIIGGLGGFGLELADWLISRDAKNLVLTSRTGLRNGYQKLRKEFWDSCGINVIIISGKDASKRTDCQEILETANKLAPVDGIFNLAVSLNDALWENQSADKFEESFIGKAWATKQLDTLTRKLCPLLRHFVVFSSVSCGRGNAGQSNYAMANSVMERICERRASEDLPALAIQWGAVGDVGLVAEMQEENKNLVIGGTLQQRIFSCLQELDRFLEQKFPVVSSMVVAEKKAGSAGSLNMIDTVLNIMGLKDLKAVSLNTQFSELGMDSMMTVEIKQTLEREFELFLTAQDIRSLNFAKLQEMSAAHVSEENGSKLGLTTRAITGMEFLIRIVGSNNVNSETCLRLPSAEEVNKEEVFLIPGIEGIGSVFSTVAPKIKGRATCLQLGIQDNSSEKTIFDLANKFFTHVLSRDKNRRHFVLVGYSFGTIVAIELMRKLENAGMTGHLILIDGSPDYIRAVLNHQLPYANNKELENKILLDTIDMIAPNKVEELAEELKQHITWEEKVDVAVKHVPNDKWKMSVIDQKAILKATHKRLQMFENYNVSNMTRIKAPIILLKPTTPSLHYPIEDYGLSKITSNTVEIYEIEGNHATILDNEKVAAAINGDTLEDALSFKKLIMTK